MLTFKRSTRKNKKYMVFHNNRWIHFGDTRYEQFKDRTPLKLYSHLNHNDTKRRMNYLQRAKGIKDKNGNLTYLDKNSPNYYSVKYLW
jgi:hypothetical protein